MRIFAVSTGLPTRNLIFVTGVVNTEEKLKKCKEAGFSGAMTSTVELWNKKFEK